MDWIASAAFGLDGLVKRDLVRLGMDRISILPTGGVRFEGSVEAGFLANLWLRTADRVLLILGEFEARSFEDLFQGIKRIDWPRYLPFDAQFPVRAQCARSQLKSESDCQKIVKKAVAVSLAEGHRTAQLPETGIPFQIDLSIRSDHAVVSLDSSGTALHRRGYRTWNGEAPLRETLAAAMALTSPWRPQLPLHDPCCGTGTLLIESAFIALDRAPGLNRDFACERWPFMPEKAVRLMRHQAEARFNAGRQRPLRVSGSDIDPDVLALCEKHVRQSGLEGSITLMCKDVRDVQLPQESGALLTNPPYGERMGDRRAAQAVARQLGELMRRSPGWSLSAITPDRSFERSFGHQAARRRRFYNGRLECEWMTFENR